VTAARPEGHRPARSAAEGRAERLWPLGAAEGLGEGLDEGLGEASADDAGDRAGGGAVAARRRRTFAAAWLGLACLAAVWGQSAQAATVAELFLRLSPEQTRGLSAAMRRELLDNSGQGASGYTMPSREGRWAQIHGPDALTLFGERESPVVYKTFQSPGGWQLLVVCRSRQTHGPVELASFHDTPFDLVLFLVDASLNLVEVRLEDYLPSVNVLDFVTADTVKDPRAVRDLALINQDFGACLTCHASVEDPLALDIVAVTSLNGAACANFMAQFKLLPLKWVGDRFVKPYDRAAPFDEPRPRSERPHGLYYREPGG
jgi:hypothetical protein